jgi:hypothetical protein
MDLGAAALANRPGRRLQRIGVAGDKNDRAGSNSEPIGDRQANTFRASRNDQGGPTAQCGGAGRRIRRPVAPQPRSLNSCQGISHQANSFS